MTETNMLLALLFVLVCLFAGLAFSAIKNEQTFLWSANIITKNATPEQFWLAVTGHIIISSTFAYQFFETLLS